LTGYIVHRAKREKMLVELPQVTLEGTPLKYKMQVEYLGHMFQGDGGSDVDVTPRTTIARRRFNELTWLWRDNQIGEALKISIYQSDVLSVVLWGAEGWLLTDDIQKQLNGWNSRCLSRITGRSPREEASPRTQCMCLPGIVRYRRMVWLGHILRSPGRCLERRAVLRYG
jgi:hypothetical protein